MAKVVLIKNGEAMQEIPLAKERVTIGRRPGNDIVIPSMAVSGEHAVIVTRRGESILQDLNSTNGTLVNGRPVKQHFLKNDDTIELAEHKLRYIAASVSGERPGAEDAAPRTAAPARDGLTRRLAAIKIIDGPNAGKRIVLTKELTTIGGNGGQIAVIAAAEHGYSIAHVEGNSKPAVNGAPIGAAPYELGHGDIIEFAGTRLVFAW